MKIAIPVSNGRLYVHFGQCPAFAMIETDAEAKIVLGREDLAAPPHVHGLLPGWLAERGAKVVIAGGMGGHARELCEANGMEVVLGAPREPVEALALAYLEGRLASGPNSCGHGAHDHECGH